MRLLDMRWIITFVVGASMLLVLAGCGGDDPTPVPAAPKATPTPAPPTATPTPLPPGVTPVPTATPTPKPAPPEPDPGVTFEGKTIRITANSSPGGGTDTQGRVMASYLGKYIPGNPRVVFTNQPNKPQEYIYAATRAPKDGTYISWNSTPQLDFGFREDTKFIKRSTFEFVGTTIDPTRAFMVYEPELNLGAGAQDKCLEDFSGLSSTGGGRHGEFKLADEVSDIRAGSVNFVSYIIAMEDLNVPFKYYAFDTVDTNATLTMWARGDINTTIRSSIWYRFPMEQPDWIPNKKLISMKGMGPGTLRGNAQTDKTCGDIVDNMSADRHEVYAVINHPINFMSKAVWLPPGTDKAIADTLAASFSKAFTEDPDLAQTYGDVAGEVISFTPRSAEMSQSVKDNEDRLEAGKPIVDAETERVLAKYFPQYVGG